jgi:hypothetical protein
MDAPAHIETAPMEPNGTAPGTAVARIRELLATMEAELTLHERNVAPEDDHIDSWHLEGGTGEETASTTEAATTGITEVARDIGVAGQPAVVAGDQVVVGQEPATIIAEQVDPLDESLEAVELELALHNQNLISLGFEESVQTALKDTGGEMLFQMRVEREDCQRVAAVRLGSGEEQQFALVIMPPGGGLMRVEPVEHSSNPLAQITESYASLIDTFRAAA